MVIQLVQTCWDALTKSCSLGPLPDVSQSHFWYDPAMIQYQVFLLPTEGFVSRIKEKARFEEVLHLQRLHGMDTSAKNQSSEVNKVS